MHTENERVDMKIRNRNILKKSSMASPSKNLHSDYSALTKIKNRSVL